MNGPEKTQEILPYFSDSTKKNVGELVEGALLCSALALGIIALASGAEGVKNFGNGLNSLFHNPIVTGIAGGIGGVVGGVIGKGVLDVYRHNKKVRQDEKGRAELLRRGKQTNNESYAEAEQFVRDLKAGKVTF